MAKEKKWRDLVETLDEEMTCGRRREQGMDNPNSPHHFTEPGEGLDRWEKFKSNGDRVCSYCGSLHPDDFMRLVKLSAETPEDQPDGVSIDPSDKGYKIYVRQPGVFNAHDGGIKFYTQHLNGIPTDDQQSLYKEAQRRSRVRFETMMKQRFPLQESNK